MNSWSRAIRRVFCCGPGELEEVSNNEPVYEVLNSQHQAHDAASALQLMGEWVDELRWMLAPIATVPERLRRLELSLHPLLVYRPDEEDYMDMNGFRPAPAAPPPDPLARSVWVAWLQERVDYGEPW